MVLRICNKDVSPDTAEMSVTPKSYYALYADCVCLYKWIMEASINPVLKIPFSVYSGVSQFLYHV